MKFTIAAVLIETVYSMTSNRGSKCDGTPVGENLAESLTGGLSRCYDKC